jgi:hypothetical protein
MDFHSWPLNTKKQSSLVIFMRRTDDEQQDFLVAPFSDNQLFLLGVVQAAQRFIPGAVIET